MTLFKLGICINALVFTLIAIIISTIHIPAVREFWINLSSNSETKIKITTTINDLFNIETPTFLNIFKYFSYLLFMLITFIAGVVIPIRKMDDDKRRSLEYFNNPKNTRVVALNNYLLVSILSIPSIGGILMLISYKKAREQIFEREVIKHNFDQPNNFDLLELKQPTKNVGEWSFVRDLSHIELLDEYDD